MFSIKRLLFGTLRRQLVLGVTLTNALMMALFVWDATYRQRQMLLERQTEYAVALAQSIATSSAGWLSALDFQGLQEIVRSQKRYPELQFAMILDMRGRVVAHIDPSHLNQYVLDLPRKTPEQSEFYILHRSAALVDVLNPVILANHQIGWVRVGLSGQTLHRRLAVLVRDGAIYALISILLSAIWVGLMGWRLTRRLQLIHAASEAIQAGSYDHRVRLKGTDEAADLGLAFDTMLDALAARGQALRMATERLQAATRAGIVGIWEWDIGKRELIWDEVMCRLYGIPAETFDRAPQTWLRIVHPNDRASAWQDLQAALRQQRDYSSEFRVVWPDGSIHYLKSAAQIIRAENGKPLRMVGVNYDLSERKRAEHELEQHRHHLEKLVEERTDELAKALNAAESANRAKSVFLANMSHELRTPLNAILGFAQLLERDQRLPSDAQLNLQTINRAGQHLLSLINEVLEISRIEAGRTTVQNAAFDLYETLTSVEEMIQFRAETKGLSFSVEHNGDLPHYVIGDAHHLRQVLINLLGNAVKYTDHGRVCLRITTKPDVIHFDVIDSGPGIPAEELPRIFQAFYQTDAGITKGEGSGLGLTISREFVRLMGGELSVESTLGQGSVFSFSLTLPETESQALALKQSQNRVIGLEPGHSNVKVLIAEDNADNQQLIACLLKPIGFDLKIAENGEQAIQLFQEWQPDFIWMDMRMPVCDGYQATRRIRELPGGDKVKIVALTASVFQEDREAILATGCDDMLAKPLDETRMFLLMGELLNLHYLYSDQAPSDKKQAPPPLEELHIPAPIRSKLRDAAELLDIDGVQAVVDELMTSHPKQAQIIAEWLSNFRFEKIIALCQHNEEKNR